MKKNWIKKPTHHQVNNGLSIVVILMGLYIVLMPFLPQIAFWFKGGAQYVYRGELSAGQDDSNLIEPPRDNRLVIPDLSLDEEVIEGGNLGVINDGGTWRRPNTSTPDKGGNTVIVGHRFTYAGASTFYHLDKMKPGQKFGVWWEGKEYVYEVFAKEVVPATQLRVENPTEEPIVTLYTCTPLWTAKDRLVVQAKLISGGEGS